MRADSIASLLLPLLWPGFVTAVPDDAQTKLPEQFAEVVLNVEGMT